MTKHKRYNQAQVLIVGAGPAGLSAAIKLKAIRPQTEVCIIEKAPEPGNHNLSGAVLEAHSVHNLLDSSYPQWRQTEQAQNILANKVEKDNILFCLGKKFSFNILFAVKIARLLGLNFGQMVHKNDYIVSISRLTGWLSSIAEKIGVEVITGFSAEDIILDETGEKAAGIKLVDQGRDKQGNKQPNFLEGETILADHIVLAEGCDGLLTEKFIQKAGLQRKCPQLYSIGVKEIIKVSPEQYRDFGPGRVVHAMGYPLWTPLIGPCMFGGGIGYPTEQDHIAVGMIIGADWKYCDFNPQDALLRFKNHRFMKRFLKGGTVVEAGAKLIPEGGYYSIPRDPQNGNIGKANVIMLGDSAGFVNMLKIKGLHNAIDSGILAALAIADNIEIPENLAYKYTELFENSDIKEEMLSAKNFRQTVAQFGPLQGMPLSVLNGLLPEFEIEPDYKAMTRQRYRLKGPKDFDKDTFTAMAATEHREEQPSHLIIQDPDICREKCYPLYNSPCITFCPAGVYETVHDEVKPANPSNCLHCKTCQRKCPFDNIRWTVPEGGGGPRYNRM